MRIEAVSFGDQPMLRLVVSRKNLMALLAKLDGHPDESNCTIVGGTEAPGFMLKAEENEVHYAHRPAGLMVPETEEAIR